jgi:hypothetical protein
VSCEGESVFDESRVQSPHVFIHPYIIWIIGIVHFNVKIRATFVNAVINSCSIVRYQRRDQESAEIKTEDDQHVYIRRAPFMCLDFHMQVIICDANTKQFAICVR